MADSDRVLFTDKDRVQLPANVLGLEDCTLNLRNGNTIHWVHRDNETDGFDISQKKTVILIHGWPDTWRSWATLIPYLSSRFRIIAVDVIGFGGSLQKVESTFADDIIELISHLGLKSFSLIGHSMGSIIARDIAIKVPEKIEKLILIGSTPSSKTTGEAIEKETNILNSNQVDESFASSFQTGTFSDTKQVPAWFVKTVINEAIYNSIDAWKSGLRFLMTDERSEKEFETITAPTLIVWGKKDTIFPKEQQQKLRRLIHNSRIVEVDDAGHSTHWDKPSQVAQIINYFIY